MARAGAGDLVVLRLVAGLWLEDLRLGFLSILTLATQQAAADTRTVPEMCSHNCWLGDVSRVTTQCLLTVCPRLVVVAGVCQWCQVWAQVWEKSWYCEPAGLHGRCHGTMRAGMGHSTLSTLSTPSCHSFLCAVQIKENRLSYEALSLDWVGLTSKNLLLLTFRISLTYMIFQNHWL